MRQRYLLGRYNNLMHVQVPKMSAQNNSSPDPDSFNFASRGYSNITVESTNYYRTIQSAYAQMLGFVDKDELKFWLKEA